MSTRPAAGANWTAPTGPDMLFLEEKGPAVRVACAAGLLVLGEAVGFALAQQGFAEA